MLLEMEKIPTIRWKCEKTGERQVPHKGGLTTGKPLKDFKQKDEVGLDFLKVRSAVMERLE